MAHRFWTAVGLMSGTSGDGITAALVHVGPAAPSLRKKNTLTLIQLKTLSYPPALRRQLLRSEKLTVSELGALNVEMGERLARATLSVLREARVSPERVDVIGSHGHTVAHRPRSSPPWTWQIGEPSVIAERTGITTVADFRPRDMAAGGEGAPLVPYLDHFLFGAGPTVALQNIGGIANVTVVGRTVRQPPAFDTGPGNCLMDSAMVESSRGRIFFDRNGRLAAHGCVDRNAVAEMLAHPYFLRRPPKSTGRDLFNLEFLPVALKRMIRTRPADAVATLTFFTAASIAHQVKRFILPRFAITEMIVSGGGVYNKTLMHHLQLELPAIPVSSSAVFGIHPLAKEPMAFALMAVEAVRGRVNHVPSATGARGPAILGKIVPGRRKGGLLK